jgi:FdhE protein
VTDTSARNLAGARQELEKLAKQRPTLQESCLILAGVIEAVFAEPAPEPPLDMASGTAHEKLGAGVPLLRDAALSLDEPSLHRRWQAVCAALNQADAEALSLAVAQQTLKPAALVAEVLAGNHEAVATQADALGLNAALAATVLRLATLPALIKVTEPCQKLRPGAAWEHGYCPHCGSWPLLGEARGLEQDRHLRCGLCAASWPVGRISCPFCGNRDHRSLGYVHLEGEEDRYRAGACDLCHGYVKWVSTMFALAEPQLLVADLATLHLDLAAAERGYFVP